MAKQVIKQIDEIPWQPHPVAKGTEIKPLVTQKGDGAEVSCLLVKACAGSEIAEHVHEASDDIIYPLAGKAKVFIDGHGEFELVPGVLVRVPKNTKHKIYDIQEELLAYDVFAPPLF